MSALQGGRLRLGAKRATWLLAAITLLGFGLRFHRFLQPMFGDEISTLFVIDRSLFDTISFVATDAEITPPLYFVLAWFASKLGSAPELVRLPSLIAGTAAIPLTYLVGSRTIGRPAGLIAATVMALSPFMIFYSADARSYSVAIVLLLGSTLAMLSAVDSGRRRDWIIYAALTCLAMLTHYLAAFILGAQFLWLLWAHPPARKPALIANLGAAAAFAPWLPSALADSNSPTVATLEALQGDGLRLKLEAIEAWALGYPYVLPGEIPGKVAFVGGAAAVLIALAAVAPKIIRAFTVDRFTTSSGAVLVFAIGSATFIAEALLLWIVGTDIFGARNLNLATAGAALILAALLVAAPRQLAVASTVVVLIVLGSSTIRSQQTDNNLIDFERAASYVDTRVAPEDVVVDLASAAVTPVPLTPLNLYMERDSDFTPYLPAGQPPYLAFTSAPIPAPEQLRQAFAKVGPKDHIFILLGPSRLLPDGSTNPSSIDLRPVLPGEPRASFELPANTKLISRGSFPGLFDLNVVELAPGGGRASGSGGERKPINDS